MKIKYFVSLIVLLLFVLIYFELRNVLSEPDNLWVSTIPKASKTNTQSGFEADCAVVLTGAPGRVREGFELLNLRQIKKLIISGTNKGATFKDLFPYWVYYPNIQEEDVVLESISATTFGNAKQTLDLSLHLKCRDIILITSQLHMYRAYKIFRATFPDDIEIKKLSLPRSKSEDFLLDVALETLKTVFYNIFSFI